MKNEDKKEEDAPLIQYQIQLSVYFVSCLEHLKLIKNEYN